MQICAETRMDMEPSTMIETMLDVDPADRSEMVVEVEVEPLRNFELYLDGDKSE